MVSYLHSFDSCVGVNKVSKYPGCNNVQQHGGWTSLKNASHKGKKVRWEAIYFDFRLDVGVCNFNHVNGIISKTKFLQSRKYKIPINSIKSFKEVQRYHRKTFIQFI